MTLVDKVIYSIFSPTVKKEVLIKQASDRNYLSSLSLEVFDYGSSWQMPPHPSRPSLSWGPVWENRGE